MIQFDNFFQMGWNHQLEICLLFLWKESPYDRDYHGFAALPIKVSTCINQQSIEGSQVIWFH